ncbi:hypothetical protein [Tellurirhabdus bombi]|uniref:hypothetical protein n=1 Tax=Tellurirhabdus bombi TaxID=2907205 RepID=UPI001F3C6ADB|nr:hypothetical protein [Tellurirhabdus bombi]
MSQFFKLNTRFWQLDKQKSFTPHETRLFFYLLNVANELGWPAEFEHADSKTCGNVAMSTNGMKNARTTLVEAGLFQFTEGGKGRANGVRYHFSYHGVTPKTTPNVTPKGGKKLEKVSRKLSPGDTNTTIIETKEIDREEKGENELSNLDLKNTQSAAQKPPVAPPPQEQEPPPEPDLMSQYKTDLLGSRSWQEQTAKTLKRKADWILQHIELYFDEMGPTGQDKGRTFSDVRKHCYYWMKDQSQRQQRDDQRNQQSKPRSSNSASGQPARPAKQVPVTTDDDLIARLEARKESLGFVG